MTAVSLSFHLPTRILSLCRDLLPGFSHVFRTDGPNRSYSLMLMTLKIPPPPALEQWSKCTFQGQGNVPTCVQASTCRGFSLQVKQWSRSLHFFQHLQLLVSETTGFSSSRSDDWKYICSRMVFSNVFSLLK